MEPRPVGGVPSVGGFLRDPSPYLREFKRKPLKIPNGLVYKRDRGLNLAPPVHIGIGTCIKNWPLHRDDRCMEVLL